MDRPSSVAAWWSCGRWNRPEFQGRHLATDAVTAVLRRAAEDGRWGTIHAYPAITNAASNRLCRRTGFTLVGPHDKLFRGRTFHTNHWSTEPEPRL